MVNDLLDLVKVEVGCLEIVIWDFSVEDLFVSLCGLLWLLFINLVVQLSFEVVLDLLQLYVDEQKVVQVLCNFVFNVLKFIEQGQVCVLVCYDGVCGCVIFIVEDSGIGILVVEQECIFEEFGQVEGWLQWGGIGLGLLLLCCLVQLMGGDLKVCSELR